MTDNEALSVVKLHGDMIRYNPFVPFEKNNAHSVTATAFFISPTDLLTCFHCVDSCITVSISIPAKNQERYPVEIVAIIPEFDIALLRIASPLPFEHTVLVLDDDTPVKPLDTVIALGYPLDSESLKYTRGVVSGFYEEFIQMDASINPGNSGGPLVRATDKKVVGINSQKMESAENTGFAVPALVFTLWKQYISTHYNTSTLVIRLFDPLITTCNMSHDSIKLIKRNHQLFTHDSGQLVTRTWTADLREGDVLCEIWGSKIDNFGYMTNRFGNRAHLTMALMLFTPDDDPIHVLVFRGNRYVTFEMSFHVSPRLGPKRSLYRPFEEPVCAVMGGLVFMEVTDDLVAASMTSTRINHTARLALLNRTMDDPYSPIVILSSILVGSPIGDEGTLAPGDVIYSMNGIRIRGLDDMRQHLTEHIVLVTASRKVMVTTLKRVNDIDSLLLPLYNITNRLTNSKGVTDP